MSTARVQQVLAARSAFSLPEISKLLGTRQNRTLHPFLVAAIMLFSSKTMRAFFGVASEARARKELKGSVGITE